MKGPVSNKSRPFWELFVFWGALIPIFYLISLQNYLLSHSLAELFNIVIFTGIFVFFWNTRRFINNGYLLFIGIACLFIGFIDLFHMFAYKDIGVFSGHNANLSVQLWIATRYLQSLSFLVGIFFIGRKLKIGWVMSGFTAITALLLASIFYWDIFPDCFIEGEGFTLFGQASEYTIAFFLLLAVWLLWQRRRAFERSVSLWLGGAMLVMVGSELIFTLSMDIEGFANLTGNILEIISAYFLYKAFVETGLREPYSLLFRELKQSEEALRESEERYRNLVELLPDGVAIHQEGHFVFVNQAGADLLGAQDPEQLLGHDITAFIHPDYQETVSKRIRRKSEYERVSFLEQKFVRLDGTPVDVEVAGTGFVHRGVPAVLTVFRDITERKRTEAALREAKDYAELLIETASVMIIGLDVAGDIQVYNEAAETITGYSKSDLEGQNWFEVIAPKDKYPEVWAEFTKLSMDEMPSTYENPIQTKAGKERIISWRNSALREEDKIVGAIAFGIDITERKRAETALRESRESLIKAQRIGRLGNWEWDMENNTLNWSEELYQIFGVDPESFALTYENIASMVHPGDQDINQQKVNALFTSTEPVSWELRIVRPDGAVRWVNQVVEIQRNSQGEVRRIFGIIQDITERKQTEDALRESEALFRKSFDTELVAMAISRQRDGMYLEANPGFAKVTGYERDEIIGRTSKELDFLLPTQRQALVDNLDAQGRLHGQELTFPTKQGGLRTILFSIGPIALNGEASLLATMVDITDRKRAEDALAKRNRILQTLHEVTLDIGAELEISTVLERTVQRAGDLLGADRGGGIFLYRPDEDDLYLVEASGLLGEMVGDTLRLDEGMTGKVFMSKQSMTTADYDNWPGRIQSYAEDLAGCAVLEVPLLWHDQVIGVLVWVADSPRIFDPDDIWLAEMFAAQAVVAIENALLFESEQEQRAWAEALRDTTLALNQTLDFDEVLNRILVNVENVVAHDTAGIMLLEDDIARIVCCRGYAERGVSEEAILAFRFPISDVFNIRHMYETGQPAIIPDVEKQPGWIVFPETAWIRSNIGAPIVIEGDVIGFIDLNSAKPYAFTQGHAERLQSFADQAAAAIRNARFYQSLEKLVEARTAELQETAERVKAILNYSPDAILLLDLECRVEMVNPATSEMFGYRPDELHGRSLTLLVEDAYQARLDQMLARVIERAKTDRLEVEARCKDGRIFDADLAVAPVEQDGCTAGLVCGLRDISALKEVERMKDAFVSNVSHELRTPISSIKLYHELLLKKPAKQAVYMDRLQRETDRLHHIVESVLFLSRLDQQKATLKLVPINLNALAAEYVIDRKPLAEQKSLSLAFEEIDLPFVRGDKSLLGQVLSILLTNAINYTPSGGQITVSTVVRRAEGKEWVGFAVGDTGPGISFDEQLHLFDRFFRGNAGQQSNIPGTGLGLAIVKEIVEQHGGFVEVQSRGVPGEGTVFQVWLPAG